MAVLYANNATTTLASSITNSATSLSVASGKGALFPAIGGSDYFYVTLTNTAGAIEIVKVTARSVDTFTVVRGQDGTTGLAWAAGDKVDLRITKAVLDDIKTDTKASLSSVNVTSALGYTPYNSTNPSGYTSNTGTVTSVSGTGSVAGLTLSGSVSTSGNLTLSGALSASIDNITDEHRIFNNSGDVHSTRTSFDSATASYNFGWRFIQGNANGPGVNSSSQYYSLYVGLGNEYPATGAGSYGMQIAFPRNVTTPYLAIRYNENNALGVWQKISAGYADSAGSVAWTNVTSRPTTVSSFTNDSGYITGINSSMVTTALGYTPYNNTNPSGYITASSSITGYSYGISVLDTDRTIANRLPTSTGQSVRFDFANASAVGTGGNYAGVMTFSPWTGTTGSTGDASYQLVFGSTATHGSGTPRLRLRNGIDSTWNAWYDVWTGANYAAQNAWTPVVSGGVTRISQTMWAKTGGNNNTWDGQLYSAEAYPTQVYCQASIGNTTGYLMFGLNTLDGTTDTSAGYTVIDFAWYGQGGTLQIYESGNLISSYGSYTSSTVLTITYDGSNIRYYKDGSLQRTVARATGNGLYFDSSFYNNNSSSQLYNIQFGRLAQHLIRQDNIGSFAPSLTGSGASGTWGINVTGTAGSISGYNNPTTAATANTIVYRDSSGHITGNYLFGVYLNASGGNSENPTIGQIWTQNTTDNYLRKSTPAHFISQLGLVTTANIGSYAAVNVADGCMQTNNKTIANNYTLGATTNAVSAGPITINTGVTVTISTGATWVVV